MQVGGPSSKFIPGFPAPKASGGVRQSGAAPNTPPTRPAHAATAASAADAALPAAKGAGAGELMRVRTLEEAVKLLDDQGRLPPRGGLVDLSA
jgi:hypothetical protein